MKYIPARSSFFKFTAVLLTLVIFLTPLTIPVNAQSSRSFDDQIVEQSDTPATSAPEGLSEDGEEILVRGRGDDFKSPQAARRFKLRQEALKQKLAGKKSGKVHQVAKGQYVELGLERNDRVFVILVEFGDTASTNSNIPNYQAPGPLHNQIAAPDRSTNNSTIWQQDYNKAHYQDMYFNKMVNYYQTQSSGRYTINGDVTEWVKVPFNGARYGANSPNVGDTGAWTLIADAINIWTKDQLASGKTLAEVTAYLKTFDQWDRYDYNSNGNFDESDGYIDHFQIVHSGAGEETGGGAQGANAIWSHRWQVWYNRAGIDGPAFNKDGGVEFGGGWGANPTGSTTGATGASLSSVNPTTAANVTYAHPINRTGIWVGDYTIQPENGGLGVFAHEYGHDLGLPDQYDTTNAGTNSTGFWTIMSSGSYLGDGATDIGSRPGDFSAWDKLQLGWLNYDTATAGVYSDHKLGPAETNTKKAQAVVVSLPPEKNDFYLFDPAAGKLQYGTKAFWGGMDNNLDTNMTRLLTVPAGASTLNMRLLYNIETNWDYAYVSVSNDNGATWTNLAGTFTGSNGNQAALTTNTNPNGQNLGNGITGTSITATANPNAPNGWRLASFNMSAYAGQTVLLRVRYKTDAFDVFSGILVDEISFHGFTDNAENGDSNWTMNGFKVTSGVEASNAPHYYIAEYRQYRTYDQTLQTGPYTFGFVDKPNWVHHYPYQDGLLITYWDTAQANNNTSQHRGEGRSIPIDAHPEPLLRTGLQKGGQAWNFSPWSSAIQSYDATFGLEPTDPLYLPFAGTLSGAINDTGCLNPVTTGTAPNTITTTRCQFETSYPSLPGVSLFNDMNSYWSPVTPTAGIIVPKTGTSIRVVNTSAQGSMMQVQVGAAQ